MYNLKEVIIKCGEKDQKAQKEFYFFYAQKLFNICKRYLKDSDRAKDLLQDSFIKIFDNLHQYSGNSPIEAWMGRITANTCIQHLKKEKKLQESAIDDYPLTTVEDDEVEGGSYSSEMLFKALDMLDDNFKAVFNLFVFEEYSHKEIAEILNINENTSRSRLSRARNNIKENLETLKH